MAAELDDERITAWGLLVEAQAAVMRRIERDLEQEAGLPGTWFEVLLRLGRTPGGRLRMTELAGSVAFSSGGFTRLADRMEAAGLLRREPCPTDRRSSFAVLTEAGRERLDAAVAVHLRGLQAYVVDPLGPAALAALAAAARTLRDANRDG